MKNNNIKTKEENKKLEKNNSQASIRIRKSSTNIKFLLEKEFKQFFRNSFLPKLVTAFPFLILLIFPLIANMEVKNVNLSIIDNDQTSYSRDLIHKIESSGYFRITDVSGTYNEALDKIENDEADIILEIPNNFERTLSTDKTVPVMIIANAVNGTKGGMGSSYLSAIINNFSSQVRLEWLQPTSKLSTPSIETTSLFRYNPRLDYRTFMIPAIMVMLLAMVCGFLPCLNIVGEKENGTIEQMNVTPVGKFKLILSKLIPYWVIGFIALTICFIVAALVYSLTPKGGILTIYLFVSVFILAFSGFGLIISNYAKSVQQAMFMMFFFVMTLIFMSGLFTPVANMPAWAQVLSYFSPLKYIIEVFRMIYLKGSGFFDLIPQFLALCGFAVFFNAWAVLSYRKTK
jgi:ABC-2 type transport system permease protein